MAIDTMDKIVAALQVGQQLDFYKIDVGSEAAGTWHSLWKVGGAPTPATANPGSLAGAIPDRTTLGAFTRMVNPGAGKRLHALQAAASSSRVGKLILYDRLWHNSEMSGTVAVDTTLGATPALTRPDALGAGVELWAEFYTAIGATGATLTVKYVNQDGLADQLATYTHPANAETVGQMVPLILASGDTGVRRATSYAWSISTGTAGNFGLTLLRRIAEVGIVVANGGIQLDFAGLGMPEVLPDACLALMVHCSTTATNIWQGRFLLGEG